MGWSPECSPGGHLGSAAEKSVSGQLWGPQRNKGKESHCHKTQPPLGSYIVLCLLHSFILSFSHSCHTCLGSGLLLGDWTEKRIRRTQPSRSTWNVLG